MAENLKPVVISSDGSKHVIATEGEKLDSQFINKETLISSDADNQLKAGTDGNLFVPPAEQQPIDPATLVSAEAGNTLTTAVDGKLFVPAPATPDVPTPAELISTDQEKIRKLADYIVICLVILLQNSMGYVL